MLRERFFRLVLADLRSMPRRALISAVGVAIASCVLLLVVGHGFAVKAVVTEKVMRELPIHMLEVVPRTLDLGIVKLDAHKLFGGSQLSASKLQALSQIEGVSASFPKLEVKLPMGARGGRSLFGRNLYTDIFMVGLPLELLEPEIGENLGTPPGVIPVIISDQLLEIYNQSVASALGTPQITSDLIAGFEFELVLGQSLMLGTKGARAKGVRKARIVGASRYGLRLGVTVPLHVARKLIQKYGEPSAAESYASVLLQAESPENIPRIAREVEALGLSLNKGARHVADMMNMVLIVLALLGGSMLAMAALNIGHSFFAQVTERKVEIGILRALGATRQNVMLMFLSQAIILGLVGGFAGCILGLGLAAMLDGWVLGMLPNFAFKPDTLFLFPLHVLAWVWLAAMVAAAVGAAWPAWRAANASVTEALS